MAEAAINFVGAQAWPESVMNQLAVKRRDMARELFKKSYDSLTIGEQFQIAQQLQSDPELTAPKSEDEMRRIMDVATQNDIERRARITRKLPEDLQRNLERTLTHVTGYDASFTDHGVRLILTRSQVKRYEDLIVESYREMLPLVFSMPELETMSPDDRQQILNDMMSSARKIARAKLFTEQGQ